jgi:hypothetical protein
MELQAWSVLLFALKWVFMGLVFFMLSVVLMAVRREFSSRVASKPVETTFAPGQLKILHSGSDPQKRAGELIGLKPLTSLGSERDNDVVIAGTFISRHHARLRWDGAVWAVEDLGSQNGTFVNQVRCEPFQAVQVPGGASLKLGDMVFELID